MKKRELKREIDLLVEENEELRVMANAYSARADELQAELSGLQGTIASTPDPASVIAIVIGECKVQRKRAEDAEVVILELRAVIDKLSGDLGYAETSARIAEQERDALRARLAAADVLLREVTVCPNPNARQSHIGVEVPCGWFGRRTDLSVPAAAPEGAPAEKAGEWVNTGHSTLEGRIGHLERRLAQYLDSVGETL